MPQSLVTIDLETTGIDSTQDSVIEIGAVRFRGNRIESEFQTLVNPRRPIPNEVIELTGITNAMVASAPTLREVLPKLLMFVGNDAIVGHNVMFDLGFLRQAGIFNQNLPVDTFEVANVLLPNAPRYGLGTLVQFLGIPLPATHRALDDARATTALYQELYRRALALPLDVLADLVRLTEDVEWYGAWLFEEALRERRSEVLPRITAQPALYQQPPIEGKPLLQREETHPLDLDDLTAVFNADGHFAHLFPQYEIRPQQIEMMQAVAQAFSEPHHLLVEAGTGTGKSMAYLVPAIHWATQNQQRVLISTNTINLQDQLVEKDLPNLQQGLGIDFQYALLKGRSNYLCPRRLEQLRNKRNHSADEVRFLGKLRIWMQHTTTGDRGELNLPLATDRDLWQKISAEDEHCTHESCAVRMAGTCPFYRARRAAERAHLLVVNHSLLLADIAAENRVLPEYRYLVIDEAHHLESATTDGLTFTARQVDFERLLRELGGANSGTLGSLLGSLANSIPPDAYAALTVLVDQIQGGLTFALPHSVAFFEQLREFFNSQSQSNTNNDYDAKLRLVTKHYSTSEWQFVRHAWENLLSTLKPVCDWLNKISQALQELTDADLLNPEEEFGDGINPAARYLNEFCMRVNGLVNQPQNTSIYWLESAQQGRRISLYIAPLEVGSLLRQYIWESKRAVVLTSATLTTAAEFGYLRGRLGADQVQELNVGSPFDYKRSTLLYIPQDMPETTDRYGYQRALEKVLVDLARASAGRVLVLFTAYTQLRQTAQAIRPALEKLGIAVIDQNTGSARQQLIEQFRTGGPAILLGTRSFWEGVDIPGPALSVVVLTKFPFDVPTDPVVAARSETFANPFTEYSVPEAILRFRQGFGRLIRTQTDRGVVVVLDRRVLSKGYGKSFLDSLPECTQQRGTMAGLPQATAKWLQ